MRNTTRGTKRTTDNFDDRTADLAEIVGEKTQIENMIIPILAEIGGNLHVGLAALGAAVGVGLIGMGASSAVGRNPGAATPILVQAILAIAFAEAIVFYALFLVK